jgi:hypothetical protein
MERKKLRRVEMAIKLVRNHKKGKAFLTTEGLNRLTKIINLEDKR